MNVTKNCSQAEHEGGPSSADDPLLYDLVESANYIDNFLHVCSISFSIIGIPFNLLVIGIILFWKRLHLPRTFTWIGIGVSNICLLASHLIEDVSVRLRASSWTRSFCTWLVILSIASQTLNFNLAVLERHISITYPNFHKKHVNTTLITALQLGFLLLIFLSGILNFHLVWGEPTPESQFASQGNFQLIGSFIIGVFPICLAGQVIAMGIKAGKNYTSIELIHLKPMCKKSPEKNDASDIFETENGQQQSIGHFVFIGRNRVSMFELDAAQSIYFISKVYLGLMAPAFILFVAVSLCLQIASLTRGTAVEYNSTCSSLMKVYYYTVVLLNCIHSSIASPISYVFVSHDFLSVLMARNSKNTATVIQEFSCAE